MIIADTGFWLALANRKDQHHDRAREYLASLDEPLVTTWPVVTETCDLLLDRLGPVSQQSYLRSFAGGAFDVFDLRREDAPRIGNLMAKYAEPSWTWPMPPWFSWPSTWAMGASCRRIKEISVPTDGSSTGPSRIFFSIPDLGYYRAAYWCPAPGAPG
jgi:hypothetical protein